jgi:hypothetical protein
MQDAARLAHRMRPQILYDVCRDTAAALSSSHLRLDVTAEPEPMSAGYQGLSPGVKGKTSRGEHTATPRL